ncbi:MAG: DUF4416 family protein [bacterium]|nr:DUF4416 family protein [bacterium]
MGEIKIPKRVKLIIGMISGDEELFWEAKERLSKRFGEVDFESTILPFSHTSYYEKEMGKDLKRCFLSLKDLIDRESLPDIKIFTNQLEDHFSVDGKRRINLDPGYVSLDKLILASTKDYRHRIYLKNGVYAEVTLFWRKKEGFKTWEWTYPDYRTKEYIEIFNRIREIYAKQVS